MKLSRVISGGQTGVDRGALEAALRLDFPHGGWYPKGSACEDKIDLGSRFPSMKEHASSLYPPRTASNVRDSDVTLILHDPRMDMGKGTALTFKLVKQYSRPLIEVLADETRTLEETVDEVAKKLEALFSDDFVLNVAGPRGSSWPKGFELSYKLIARLIERSTLHSS